MVREIDIRDSNPWWKDRSSINNDEKIIEWKSSHLQYDPRLRRMIAYDFEPSNTVIYTLRGPRQVGKTTLVKLQIRDFLMKATRPWNVFYCSLDLARTPQDVVDVVETYLRISARQRGKRRTYMFLDEVSSVPDWQKGIKWLVDSGKLVNCTVMATGSRALNIKNMTERLPGRRGAIDDSHDKILLPMKFSEYACHLNKEIGDVIKDNQLHSFSRRMDVFADLLSGNIGKRLDKLSTYQNEIDDLLSRYMITGGTPKVIDGFEKTGIIDENIYTAYLESITGEWSRMSKNETLLKQFGGAIIRGMGSHASWANLAREAALGSPNTSQDYAYVLKDLFVLSVIHRYGTKQKIPMINSPKKFYFRDPLFLHIFNGWMGPNPTFDTCIEYLDCEDSKGRVLEGIVGDHLIRWAFSMSKKKQTYDYSSHVFYWKDDKNREVDFVLYDGGSIEVPIEVKFRNRLNRKKLAPVVNFLGETGNRRGLVVSKSLLDVTPDYAIVPAGLFLLLV